MSDSSRVQLSYVAESTWGTTPASALTNMRITGESLKYNIGTDKSAELRSDRQTTDLIQTSFDASGDVNFELSYGSFDDMFKAALYSAGWSTTVAVSATDISAANADNSYNSTTTDFTTENISVGQWIKVGGFTDSANNGFAKVVSVTANKIVVSNLTLADEAAGDTVTMAGSMIRNGTTQESFSIEKKFDDITQFVGFRGMVPNTLALNIESQSKVTGTIGFTGKDAVGPQGTTIGTGAPNAANSNQVLSVGSHIQNVREAGALLSSTAYARTINFSLNNNNRNKDAVGQKGAVGISAGSVEITGTLTAYFEDETLYQKFINNTSSSLDYRIEDDAGNAYVITFPNVKYSDGNVVAGGQNEFVVAEMSFEAILDTTTDCMIQIDRFAA